MKGIRIWTLAIAALGLVLFAGGAIAQEGESKGEEKEKPKVAVEEWLVLGPIDVPLPAFNNEGDSKAGAPELLAYRHLALESIAPKPGASVALIGGRQAEWSSASAGTSGVVLDTGGEQPAVCYLAAYVEVPRWMQVDVEARSNHPFELFIGRESVAKQSKADKKEDAKASGTAKLEQGKHLLVVKTVNLPTDSLDAWNVGVTLSPAKDFDDLPRVSLDPTRVMTIEDVIGGPFASGIDVSPDGSLVMMSLSRRRGPEGDTDSWREIRRVADGSVVRVIRDSRASSWEWAPSGNRLSYVSRDDDKAAVRVLDIDTSEIQTIVEGVEDFGDYEWSPDGSYIAYSVRSEAEKSKTGVKRMRGVSDRRRNERDRSSLYAASVPAGVTRRITAGEYSSRLIAIHPDGRKMLINREHEELADEPYEVDELVLLDLDDQSVDVLWTGRWLDWGRWSPDGKKILLVGGPSAFGEIGHDVPDGVTPNNYDTQAYLFDPATKEVDPITREFDPDVQSYWWPKGGDIYFVGGAGEFNRLYRYNVKKRSFKEIELPCDVIHSGDAGSEKAVAVLVGSNANRPARVFSVDLKSGKVRTLFEPARERFADVTIGEVEDFDFTSSAGTEIVGRVHFPPGFDPEKKWPCIVYYYGGTSPVTRSFGGRYPKNLWAAHGYVVYVMQPSGATGFGQEFSAKHVNDWGKTTADEVIEGVKQFLDTHPYVDPERVGCIGASYGGFMTQLLVTKTDMFAAAVSHAGISDITSYWGEGYWGYQYNAVSAAESFPWNRPDIYIEQSPLFNADKVTTPLLLLHGDSDTNVPRGESDQMYAALKLLGKEVEYIRVEGQDHWILDYKKRIVWNDAIISWFDRWLKDEPEWWEDMYPPLDAEEGEPKE